MAMVSYNTPASPSNGYSNGVANVDPHRGELFVFNSNPWRKLTAFRVGDFTRCVVAVGGQSDGFFSLGYVEQLTQQLVSNGWGIVQTMFSSWYSSTGTARLENDVEDMDLLLQHLTTKKGITEIILLGYQTGTQDVLFYMQHGHLRQLVSHIILQGGIRDPTGTNDDPITQKMTKDKAEQMVAQGRGNNMLPSDLHPRAVSAFRYLALGGKQGVQDFFHPRLTEEEVAQVVGHVNIPLLVIFCCDHSYKPTSVEKTEIRDKIQTCVSANVSCEWIAGSADEQLNFLAGFENELTGLVINFVLDEERKRFAKEDEARREQEADAKAKRSIVYHKHGLRRTLSQSSMSSSP